VAYGLYGGALSIAQKIHTSEHDENALVRPNPDKPASRFRKVGIRREWPESNSGWRKLRGLADRVHGATK
jgi:hypothetical protein